MSHTCPCSFCTYPLEGRLGRPLDRDFCDCPRDSPCVPTLFHYLDSAVPGYPIEKTGMEPVSKWFRMCPGNQDSMFLYIPFCPDHVPCVQMAWTCVPALFCNQDRFSLYCPWLSWPLDYILCLSLLFLHFSLFLHISIWCLECPQISFPKLSWMSRGCPRYSCLGYP